MEQLTLEFWLSKAREYLTADDANTKLLLASRAPRPCRPAWPRARGWRSGAAQGAVDGGLKAVMASTDPMIQYVLKIDPQARLLRAA